MITDYFLILDYVTYCLPGGLWSWGKGVGSELTVIHDSQPAIWPNWLRSFVNLPGGGEREKGGKEKGGKEGETKKIIRKNPHNSC